MKERILDACCLINLFASGEKTSILQACGEFCVSEQVASEALRIGGIDDEDPSRLVPREIDLEAVIRSGLIKACRLEGPAEVEAFVRFAMELGDGEASCLAIAKSRGWTPATDDRKARRIASENGIALTSTPELIQEWFQATGAEEATLIGLLQNIERFARFRPRRPDPLHAWWMRHRA